MAAPTAFWDKIADGYAKMPIADEAAYEKKLAKTREYLTPDSQLLEFACGTGGTAIKHAPFVKHIDAIDISAKMIEFCEQKRQATHVDNVSFKQDTIESLKAASGQYDVVMGMSILHLLEDKDFVIRKVYDLLKPGGVFISSTICLGDSMPFFRFIAPIGKLFGKMPLVRSLKVEPLQACMQAAGFEVEYRWQPTAKSAVFLIVRKPG